MGTTTTSETGDVAHTESIGSVDGVAHDTTHRRLKERHIQLIGIGGTIGTALFVGIGRGLALGGPGNLLLGFTLWCV